MAVCFAAKNLVQIVPRSRNNGETWGTLFSRMFIGPSPLNSVAQGDKVEGVRRS